MRKPHIIVKLKRLYKSCLADCRDYIWERAKRQKKGLKFYVEDTGRWITVPFDKLQEGEIGTKIFYSKQVNSKYPTYRLVTFMVTPQEEKDKQVEPEQVNIINNPRFFEAMRKALGR